MSTENQLKKPESSKSERFSEMVMTEYNQTTPNITDNMAAFHKRLCQNYFIKLDLSLKTAEEKRMSKPESKREKVPMIWDNLNLQQLALDVVSFARIGLDPLQPNHINLIPYKNSRTGKYDIGFIVGYRGIEIKAKKYGIDMPDDIIVELVYKKDTFKVFKKSVNNSMEHYDFDIENAFDRGDCVGGFYYYIYNENHSKNKIKAFNMADILKRKPKYAAAEFWGGEKDKYENGTKKGKEKVEGWTDEMYYKTIYRAAYNNITIDSEKIDNDFMKLIETTGYVVDENQSQLPEANSQSLKPSVEKPEIENNQEQEIEEIDDNDKTPKADF